MTTSLDAENISDLREIANRGFAGVSDYYKYLESRGYEYADLALGVVEQSSLPGRQAVGYLESVARENDIFPKQSDIQNINVAIMDEDLAERERVLLSRGSVDDLSGLEVYDVHQRAFENLGYDISY